MTTPTARVGILQSLSGQRASEETTTNRLEATGMKENNTSRVTPTDVNKAYIRHSSGYHY